MYLAPFKKSVRPSLFEELLWDRPFYSESKPVFAPLDIHQNEKEVVVKVELPGLKKEEISIQYEDGILEISGEKKQEETHEEKNVVYTEISKGNFKRRVNVGQDIQFDQAKASYTDGVLSVVLPKSIEKTSKTLSIQ